MKFARLCVVTSLMAIISSLAFGGALIIDHRHTDITKLTAAQINRAKAVLHIAYGHTSHGSQVTDGMSGLVGFANGGGKGLSLPNNIFAWNNGGTGGALDLHDYAMGGDVGYYPDWYNNTISYLNNPANSNVNVIIWSWCGQMSSKYASGTLTNEYLAPMSALEAMYTNVIFVYMTGHVDLWDDADNKAGCRIIRDYCIARNKVLYDFNDIERYNPDGTYYEFVTDGCDYYTGVGTGYQGNWATMWQNSHTENVDWYNCSSAHSEPLNANQKAYAAWALWCALAADMNRDELPDEWANRYGGPQMVKGGTNDCDHDGMTDYQEYIADTVPTAGASKFQFSGANFDGGLSFTFPCTNSRIYRLDYCESLNAGSWLPVQGMTNQPGQSDGEMSLTDTNNAACRSYRVSVRVP
jgi:hypothetical protein